MIQIVEEQFSLLKDYQELLHILEKAFNYTIKSFTDIERTEGDRVLQDIMQALLHISHTNKYLVLAFKEHHSMKEALDAFDVVTEKAILLEGDLENTEKKQQIIREQLYPAFAAWSVMIQQELKPYTQS